jgi:hypothetical protein
MRSWSSVISVIKTTGKLVAGVIGFFAGAVGSIFLFWMRKKIRLHIYILHPPGQKELVTITEAEASVQRANNLLKDKYNTEICHYGDPYIEIEKASSPAGILNIQHSNWHWGDRDGNNFIATRSAGWNGIPVSLQYPITIFVVQTITNTETGKPWRGFFEGFITDNIFITPSGMNDATTLAHEISHCMLWHTKNKANLMYHEPDRGTDITGWQKWLFRTSRNVNFW